MGINRAVSTPRDIHTTIMGLRLLAVACLVGAAFAGPLQSQSQCASSCPSTSHQKFDYEPGRKYVYDYQGVNHVVVAGQRRQKAQITGQVEIHVLSKCEFVLQMQNIRIEQKATQQETSDLIRQLQIPLPFAFEDGKVNHTCPSSEDTRQSQNIKKGVLSTLVNSMDQLDKSQELKEVDSLGTCKTKYTVQRAEESGAVIEKQKDLKSCTNRHSSITSLMTSQYESPDSDIHTLPIFPQEKLTCRQVVERRIMKSVKCKEQSAIKPLAQGDSVIEFEGQVDLQLSRVESSGNVRRHAMSVQDPIQFNLEQDSSVEDREQEVQEHLREMCSKNTDTIDISVSKDFISLVTAVKRLSYESLQRIYSQLESGRLCSSKKLTDLFLDTLPMAGNDAAIKLMVHLLQQQKVAGLKAKLWTASLALVSHPSQGAIDAVVPLIREQKSGSVLLGVSAMVYRYCSHKNNHCENQQSVRDIVSTLNEVLGRQCQFDNENEAIAALKAFGNMGQLLQAEQNILACAKDSDKSIRVRLAAIDAFRRVNKVRPEALVKLYTDSQEHYEVRIAALSSVLKHADRRQIQSIKQVAEHESDEQVSAYTGTIISNMNKTSSPLKKHVKELLSEFQIQTPEVGYWENSKNIELSTFSEPLNVGGAVETDIIHAAHSKIPRSVYTRFDLDVFDKHMNIFEVGLRAEGLEAAFRKLIGFQEAKKQKASWSFLQSSNDIEDEKVEASIFFRTMNTEIFDFSASDLTGMGEMIKIADVLSKISHDKSADFSHSFMFMNSQLIIPSVTGRSYSFGLTGSATVGLTASSKVDIVNIMSRPKNGDVHGHFQPSVNVELAATVGIHSDKPRPDVKIVTRLHSESDIAAQFQIKDGHLGLVKLSMPSENVVLSRVSSDIVEIDAQHQERRIYENMQTKIDHCFDNLEKPLGVSVCAKWEVPRPFMSRTFPFVKGVGNVELSIKKTDAGMKGYELSFEMPKHKNHLMKYTASLDTPGSRINRRFSAELEVRMPSQDQKQFSFQLQSPFRSGSASASGHLTMRQDSIEGSADIQAGSSQRYSVRASSSISESASQKTYRPSIQISSQSSQPLKVDGTVTVTKGRKQQISFDLKSNKPSRKPLMLTGTVMKDGSLSFSKSAEWKLSSDVALNTPMANFQIRSSAEKQSKQAQTIATSLTVDYEKERSRKQSVKLTAKMQQSSSKIRCVAQLETTEFPSANLALTWNMQGKLRESLKNDITVKYGRNPEQQYINILQSSKMSASQPGEFRVAVKAPQFDVDSDLSVTHDIRNKAKIHADVDLRYKKDKHIQTKFQLDNLSERPLKLRVKAELQTPSKRFMYQDELEEIAPNTYKGNAAFEWRSDKRAELQYKYQKLSDRSKMHHEMETTLRLPNSRSPIKNKASIQMSQQNIGFEGRLSLDRRSEYSLKAHLNKRGASYASLKIPKLEGNLKFVNDQDKKAADLDLKSNLFRSSRHVIASAALGLGSQKKLEAEISLDADRQPEQKILISSTFERQSRNQFSSSSKLQIADKANIEISASGDLAFYGTHEASFQGSLFHQEPVGLVIRHEMTPRKMSSQIKISKNQRQKVDITLGGDYSKAGKEIQLSTSGSVKSLDNSFPTKTWSTQGSFSRSGSYVTLKSHARFEWSPNKMYQSEMNYDFQPSVVLMKAYLHTPHINFQKQSVGFSFQKSGSLIASSATIELSNGKSISITSETQQKASGLSSSLAINSPFDIIRNVRVLASWEKLESQKSLKSSVDVNGARQAEAELSMTSSSRATEIRGRAKVAQSPELSARITLEKSGESFKYDIQVMKDSSSLMSTTVSKQVSSQKYSYALQSSSNNKNLVSLKLSKESSAESTKHILEAKGPFPQVSAYLESSEKDKNSLSFGVKACQKSHEKSCYSVKAFHKALANKENYMYYRKLTFDVEKSSGNSSPERVANINILASHKENDYREKFIVETKEKKLGYELRFNHRANDQDHCRLDSHIFMPHRTLRVRGSALHNEKSFLLDFEIVPDAAQPSRKLGFEVKKEQQGNEVSGFVKMLYPGMKDALQLSGRIQTEGKLPVGGRLKVDYSSIGGKVLTLDIVPEQQGRRQNERRSIQYKLFSEDKTIDISAKLTKHVTQQESEFSYEWSCQTQQGQKKGKASLKLSEKRNGKPQAIEAEITTPSSSSKLSCRVKWNQHVPSGLQLSLASNNENLVELDIKTADNCLIVEETIKSRQFMKNQVCVGKEENGKFQLISVQSYYQSRQSLNFEIAVDPQHPHLANINLDWDKRNFRLALREARQLSYELLSHYISEADLQSMKQTFKHMHETALEAIHDAKEKISEIVSRYQQHLLKAKHFSTSAIWDHLSHYIPMEKIQQEFVQPLIKAAECLVEKYMTFFRTHLPDVFRAFWETTKRDALECIKSFCSRDSLCYEIATLLEHFEMEQAKTMVHRRVSRIRSSVSQKLQQVRFPDVREWIERTAAAISNGFRATFGSFFEGRVVRMFVDCARRVQDAISKRLTDSFESFVEWVLEIIDHAEKDEDFRVLKSLVQQTRDKAVHTWENRESILKNTWEPLRETLVEDYPKKWIRDRMDIQKFSPKEGSIQIQIHHPLERKHIQVLKNALVAMKNKVLSKK